MKFGIFELRGTIVDFGNEVAAVEADNEAPANMRAFTQSNIC